jgi:hypothetical protein
MDSGVACHLVTGQGYEGERTSLNQCTITSLAGITMEGHSMLPRVGEVRDMVKILDKEHNNVEDLAKAALQLAYDLYEQRDTYVVLMNDKVLKDLFAFGFYDTRKRAEKALVELPEPTPGACTWGVRKVIKNVE